MILAAMAVSAHETDNLVTMNRILPSADCMLFFGKCAPSLSLRILTGLNNEAASSTYTLPLFFSITPSRRRFLSDSVLSAIASQFEKQQEWNNLFEISTYNLGVVLKVLFTSNNPSTISKYVNSNISWMSRKDKRFMLENLILSYKTELLDPETLELLKNDLEDRQGLEELEVLADSQQCKICTENAISKYFSCLNAEKYRHGACKKCFIGVQSSRNAACPWCREPLKESV